MQVVLLAAGDGGRLRPLTETQPKALLPVDGRPIIDHIIDAFTACGLREFIAVVGHEGDQLRAHLARHTDGEFLCVENPEFMAGNARSLTCALPLLRPEPFLMAMSDHLRSTEMVRAAMAAADDASYVVVDSRPGEEAQLDATRVRVAPGGQVLAIGKALPEWNAIDTGLFRLQPADLRHLEGLPVEVELNNAWQTLIAARRLRAINTDGAWWIDIDTAADLARAEAHLLERKHGSRRPGLTHS